MSAAAKTADSAPDPPDLDLYRLRDDLAQSYNPANAHERMLATQIAQAWLRLQQAYDLERRYFKGRDMVDVIANHLDQFKAITRFVTDSERAWRHATVNLEKSQRRRQLAHLDPPNHRRASAHKSNPPPLPEPCPPPRPAHAPATAHTPRE